MNKQLTKRQNSLWAEISSDSQDDWNEALKLLAGSFSNGTSYLTTGLSDEDRNRLLHEYFKYVYETEMSNERGGLIFVKEKNEDDSIAIVYAHTYIHRIEFSVGDRSGMNAIDSNFADLQIREDAWIKREIVERMKQASQDLDIHVIYGAFAPCRTDRLRSGLSRRSSTKSVDILYNDGLRRGYFVKDKPCIFFGIVDDLSSLGFHKFLQNVQIAHLHVMGKPICGFEDPSLKSKSNCVFVFGSVITGNVDLKNVFAPYFESPEAFGHPLK